MLALGDFSTNTNRHRERRNEGSKEIPLFCAAKGKRGVGICHEGVEAWEGSLLLKEREEITFGILSLSRQKGMGCKMQMEVLALGGSTASSSMVPAGKAGWEPVEALF